MGSRTKEGLRRGCHAGILPVRAAQTHLTQAFQSVIHGPVQDHRLLIAGLSSEKQLMSDAKKEKRKKLLSTLFSVAEIFPSLKAAEYSLTFFLAGFPFSSRCTKQVVLGNISY